MSETNNRIGEWYQPNGEGDKTIGTCGLQNMEEATWYSSEFEDISSGDGGSDGNDGNDGGDGNDGDTSYASDEDEWCETNGHGDAVSEGNDDVSAGCKAVNDLDYSGPTEVSYYSSENAGISCAAGDDAYVCEE